MAQYLPITFDVDPDDIQTSERLRYFRPPLPFEIPSYWSDTYYGGPSNSELYPDFYRQGFLHGLMKRGWRRYQPGAIMSLLCEYPSLVPVPDYEDQQIESPPPLLYSVFPIEVGIQEHPMAILRLL